MAENDTSWAHFCCIELQSGPTHPQLEEPGKIMRKRAQPSGRFKL